MVLDRRMNSSPPIPRPLLCVMASSTSASFSYRCTTRIRANRQDGNLAQVETTFRRENHSRYSVFVSDKGAGLTESGICVPREID